MRPKRSPFEELAERILAGDVTFPEVLRTIEAEQQQLHITELEPGVVYGEAHTLSDDVRFAFAVVCLEEIAIAR